MAMSLRITDISIVEPTFLRLNPEAAINLGYDLHGAQDSYASSEAKSLSRKALDELYSLKAEPGSRDSWYMSQMISIIVSHGNGITRLKRQHIDELKNAEVYLQTKQDMMTKTQTWNALFKAAWKVAGALAMGLVGFLLTKTLALTGIVSESLINQHGHTETIVSALIGVLFFAATGAITTWWTNRVSSRVSSEYAALRDASHRRYAISKEVELDTNWRKLCTLWKWYTGNEWGELPAYLRVFKSEAEMMLARAQMVQATEQSDFSQIWCLCKAQFGKVLVKVRRAPQRT
jgi:hypothetical protein